jgi:uncharacterized protein
MNQEEIILKTQDFLKEKFATEHAGHHDYWHMYRVWRLAKYIAAQEQDVDLFTIELAALLHDIADWKFHKGDEEAGPRAAREWLGSLGVDENVIKHIEDIIRNLDFKGAGIEIQLNTIEGRSVHDADKLDAMGAIGIARAFATGAHFNESLHDPDIEVPIYASAEDYRMAKGAKGRTVINHFREKLLLLKDRMFTKTGKELAQHRHEVMEQFLEEFLGEWEVDAKITSSFHL